MSIHTTNNIQETSEARTLSPLDELVREGARRMLEAALNEEVNN